MNNSIQTDKIELLPEHIIDQIKAGEVLERPSALLKELIENSIDAKASEINIHIVENGMDLISIEDNGVGMDFSNLPFAFLRHATSKLKTFDDIYRLKSYGFRGEALASIAASSRVTCQTQPENLSIEGGKLIINGGIEELLVPMKTSKAGTSLFIKNLFYNTPARLKFIKSKTSEKIQLKKIIYSFLVSHPEIQFSIKWDEKEKEVYKKVKSDNTLERIEQIFYPRQKNHPLILSGSSEYDGHKVIVYLSTESLKNTPNKHQYLFANDRLFYDKNIHQSIIRHFVPYWNFGDSGHYALFIEIPTDELDVNVHPNKTQIKFSKNDVIQSLIVSAIKKAQSSIKSIATEDDKSLSPQSFISLEEEKRHSLDELQSRNFLSPSVDPVNFQKNIQFSDEQKILLNINAFFIYNNDSAFYLISKKLLLIKYFLELFLECSKNEDLISPLLISEPFEISTEIDKNFMELKKIGFEFDRLNQNVIVLRTIPKNIHRSTIRMAVTLLFEFFKVYELKKLEEKNLLLILNKIPDDLNSIDISFLKKLIESNNSWLPLVSKILNDQTLEEFFK